jgi:DNA-binding MarR family transcriptional regulator
VTFQLLAMARFSQGVLKRADSGDDRRVTPIALTPAGRRYIEKLLPDHFRRLTGQMGELCVSALTEIVLASTASLSF